MESIQTIKRRVKAVKNTGQITKAMEMVSANKMRRSQEAALSSRPYAFSAMEMLLELAKRTEQKPRLMQKNAVKTTLVVLIAADKGLAGSLNSNVFRKFSSLIEPKLSELRESSTEDFLFASVGKKAEDFISRRGYQDIKSFVNFGDYATIEQTKPFADFIIDGYVNKKWGRVLLLGTHFRSTLRQDVLLRELLPITPETLERTIKEIVPERGRYAETKNDADSPKNHTSWEYLVEPSPILVLESLISHLVEMSVYDLILEANASEHSARMVAMKNASDNASDLEGGLTLLYNKSRQAGITREIAEITAGAESLKN